MAKMLSSTQFLILRGTITNMTKRGGGGGRGGKSQGDVEWTINLFLRQSFRSFKLFSASAMAYAV